MPHWILILMLLGQWEPAGLTTAITNISFDTQLSCEIAGRAVVNNRKDHTVTADYVCVKQGD